MKRALDAAELFDAMAEGFRQLSDGHWTIPLRTTIDMFGHQGLALFMPSYGEALSAAGVKLATVMKENPKKDLPLIRSSYVYLNAETGEVLSLMDAELLTGMRTAVVSALVTDLLGKSDGGTMAVFGTGVQAWHHAAVFTRLFGIREILVFGQTDELSEKFAERIERRLRKPSRRAVIAELKRADVICTCTTSPVPLFKAKDIAANVHINAVGSYRPETREIGSDVMANAAIVVDSYDSALIEAGDIIIPLNEGVITRSNIHATIAELVSGIKALPDAGDRITVFKSAGIAMEDLVAADIAYRKAIELGLGTSVSL